MPRPKAYSDLTVVQLEQLLKERMSEIPRLQAQRNRLMKDLAQVEFRLGRVQGRRGRGRPAGIRAVGRPPGAVAKRTRRTRNGKSLVEVMSDVLGRNGGPMTISEVLDGVRGAGYKSKSANFRGIVNQTLLKEKRFGNVGRGTYAFKKA